MPFAWRRRAVALIVVLGSLLSASSAPAVSHDRGKRAAGAGTTFLAQSSYTANESIGRLPITIERTTNLARPEVVYYGVNLHGAQSGQNFDPIQGTRAEIPVGQRSYTFYVTVNDQGINGPTRHATAYVAAPSLGTLGNPSKAMIDLLQNDPLQNRDAENPLGYARAPTDGDPLQNVRWYVFGDTVAPGQVAGQYASSNPAWAQALHTLAYTPGSWSYRFWMWNQPTPTLAKNVRAVPAPTQR